jgi:hypothetical protein
MTLENNVSSRFTHLLPRLCGFVVLAVILVIFRVLLLRFPFCAMAAGTVFKYLSIVYLAGRLVDWFLQAVTRCVSRWLPASWHKEMIHD